MGKKVTFGLGPAASLTKRQLTITRMPGAGDDSIPLDATHDDDAGSTAETVEVDLADNTMWQAKLVDTRTSGEVSDPDILNFHTGSLQFPGPRGNEGRLSILGMEDLSSSSSSSSESSSSSSSSSDSSSSSSQSA